MVVGTANVVDCRPKIESRAAYAEAEPLHRIPLDRQERAFVEGWCTPWVLAHARQLAKPVRYDHPNGAVIWVNLNDAVATQVRKGA